MEQNSQLRSADYPLMVEAIKKHNLEGFSRFYDLCSSRVYGYIKYSLQEENTCEETLQKCFCNIWASVDEFDPARQGLFEWSFKVVKKEVSKKKIDLLLKEIFACQRKEIFKEKVAMAH